MTMDQLRDPSLFHNEMLNISRLINPSLSGGGIQGLKLQLQVSPVAHSISFQYVKDSFLFLREINSYFFTLHLIHQVRMNCEVFIFREEAIDIFPSKMQGILAMRARHMGEHVGVWVSDWNFTGFWCRRYNTSSCTTNPKPPILQNTTG